MHNRYNTVDTVINACDSEFLFTRYFNENFEHYKNGITHISAAKLRVIYNSHNGSSSDVKLQVWNGNEWCLFANSNTCNGARIEKYIANKEAHLKAFEESCEALLNLWSKLNS